MTDSEKKEKKFQLPATETAGLRGQHIVAEFLDEVIPDVIINAEETAWRDKNDQRQIDIICELPGGHKLAVDVTFATGDIKKDKQWKIFYNRMTFLKDEIGRPISGPIPRVLLYERSSEFWESYSKEAERTHQRLVDVMDDKNKKDQVIRFLRQFIDQINGLSKDDREYRSKAAPIKEIFEKKLKEIEVAA